MMAGKKVLTLFLVMLPFYGLAQLQPVYSFQKDDSLLKRQMYELSARKNSQLISSLGKENRDDYKKIYEERLDNIKDLLLSRRTVTDSVAHQYLQAVLNRIIAANPELKGTDARVVFTRDWWPNAYSMGDGTIAFNAGLLILLRNEAELAFVLCHELAHYYLDHSGLAIRKYVNTVNSDEFQKELRRLSKEQYRVNEQLENLAKKMVFDNRRHSRDKEAEADKQAFLFLKRTGYDGMGIKTALQMLDRSDDTLLFRPLKLEELFGFNDYPFKSKWTRKESAIFGAMGEDDGSGLTKKEKDSLKTHPDCSKRISLLEDSIITIKGKDFLVDEKRFEQLKKDFLAEIAEQNYRNGNFGRNLYFSLQLLQQETYRPMATVSVLRALNAIYEAQKNHKIGLAVDTETKGYPEDYNLLLRLLNRVRLDEIASLAWYFGSARQEGMKKYQGFEEEWNKARKNREANAN